MNAPLILPSAGIVPELALRAIPDDERVWVPQAKDVWFRPLLLNTVTGGWCNLLRVRKSGVLSRHRHPMVVVGYVIRGKWRYLEHDWTADEGSFVYEPPGEIHTLVVPDDCAEMITFFNISGAMIYLDDTGGRSVTRTYSRRSRCAARTTLRPGWAPPTSINSYASPCLLRIRACCLQFTAVGVGAALGAWLRWGFSFWLGPRSGAWPLGTIAANLIGGYLVGIAVAYFRVASGSAAGMATVRDHRIPGRLDHVLDLLRRSHGTVGARRPGCRDRARCGTPVRLTAVDRRRLCHRARACGVSPDLFLAQGVLNAQRDSLPPGRRSRSSAVRKRQCRRSRPWRGARSTYCDRLELHRHLSALGPLQVAAAVGSRR